MKKTLILCLLAVTCIAAQARKQEDKTVRVKGFSHDCTARIINR